MIALVSHDAGGAQILSSYAARRAGEFVFVLDGPAREIFRRKLGPIESLPLDEAIRRSTSLLCGTSWQSDLEYDAIRLARAAGKPSAAFLDHWINYPERFSRLGERCLPDAIYVGDPEALALARAAFPGVPVQLVENPYLEDIRRELAAVRTSRPSDPARLAVLYVCEPVREQGRRQFGDERHFGYVEEEALRYFLANLGALDKPVERIVIRPHPSEAADKYTWARDEFDLPIENGGSRSLVEEIVDSDVVAGCESMAMVVALIAGKRVVSCIPPGGRACGLPHSQIDHYHQLLTARIQS